MTQPRHTRVLTLFSKPTEGTARRVNSKVDHGTLPAGPVAGVQASKAGDTGSKAARGTKIPHAKGQLSPCATTREPPRCNSDLTHPQTSK